MSTVKLDVRGLKGHLDATFRAGASTLVSWVRRMIVALPAVGTLPLSFKVKLAIVRPKCVCLLVSRVLS